MADSFDVVLGYKLGDPRLGIAMTSKAAMTSGGSAAVTENLQLNPSDPLVMDIQTVWLTALL